MTKAEQTKWNKSANPKKLKKTQYWLFSEFIMEKANYTCQLCKRNLIEDMHHSIFGNFGADRDDRTLVGVCRSCHRDIHDYGDREKRELAEKIGRRNWGKYKETQC